MKVNASIQPGVCGFAAKVNVICENMFEPAKITIETNCAKIRDFSKGIQEVKGMEEVTLGSDGKIFSEARKKLTA